MFLFSVRYSDVPKVKNTPDINNWGYFIKGWGHHKPMVPGGYKRFNTTLEEYKSCINRWNSITS